MNKLKQFRVNAGMTQAKLAKAVDVSQPNYHRWEANKDPVPEAKLKRLAVVLKTTPEAILGKHPPIEAAFYDDSAPENLQYYGEVAIHFLSGGKPLLLSISEEAFQRLYRDLQGQNKFVAAQSLSNQTVAIRTKAISDLYFSSEAYDDYGPEHETNKYDDHVSLQLPDNRDWEIVECLSSDFGYEDFDEADVQRVQGRIMITDEQYKELVADGRIKAEDLEEERKNNTAKTDRIFELANHVIYQLSTGERRSVFIEGSDDDVFETFYPLVDFGDMHEDDEMILFKNAGYHRTIFINPLALDYVSLPTHKFEAGSLEMAAETLDALGDDPTPTTTPKTKKKRQTKAAEN
jgi:transcriptional regulator with XRE-family HTH domain